MHSTLGLAREGRGEPAGALGRRMKPASGLPNKNAPFLGARWTLPWCALTLTWALGLLGLVWPDWAAGRARDSALVVALHFCLPGRPWQRAPHGEEALGSCRVACREEEGRAGGHRRPLPSPQAFRTQSLGSSGAQGQAALRRAGLSRARPSRSWVQAPLQRPH